MSYQSINLAEKLTRFSDLWAPKVVAEMNDYQLKLVKVCGEFVWHTHAHTDEVFHVLTGSLDIWFRDGKVTVNAGEIYVVPKGVGTSQWLHRVPLALGRAERRGQYRRCV